MRTASYVSFENGQKASRTLSGGMGIGAHFLAITPDHADGSIKASLDRSFSDDTRYALFSFQKRLLDVDLDSYGDDINFAAIEASLLSLDAFDGTNPRTVDRYRNFFRYWGSHVITGVTYGARFQLVGVSCLN